MHVYGGASWLHYYLLSDQALNVNMQCKVQWENVMSCGNRFPR